MIFTHPPRCSLPAATSPAPHLCLCHELRLPFHHVQAFLGDLMICALSVQYHMAACRILLGLLFPRESHQSQLLITNFLSTPRPCISVRLPCPRGWRGPRNRAWSPSTAISHFSTSKSFSSFSALAASRKAYYHRPTISSSGPTGCVVMAKQQLRRRNRQN